MPEMKLSYSKIKNWRFCPQAFKYAHLDRIEPKLKPVPFALGGAIHELIELDRKHRDWRARAEEMRGEFSQLSLEEQEYFGNVPHQALQIVEGYVNFYREVDRAYQFKAIEEDFGPHELIPGVLYTAKPDAVAEDTMGRLILWEMKTGKRLPDADFRIWNLQTLLYVWAARLSGTNVQAIMWDHIRTKLPSEPKLLVKGGLSKREIDTTYETYYAAIIRNGLNPDDYSDILSALKKRRDFYMRVKLPVKEGMLNSVLEDAKVTARQIQEGRIYRNISQMHCPKCMYRALCEAALQGGDEEYIRDTLYVPKVYRMETTTRMEDEEDERDKEA